MGTIIHNCKLLEDFVQDGPVREYERVKLPQIPVCEREKNFDEVDMTLTAAEAIKEAQRCMRCYRVYAVVTPRPIPGNTKVDFEKDIAMLQG